jgi:hypothetical protein
MSDEDIATRIKRDLATYNARRHLALYERERDVRLLRAAFDEFRAVGLAAPLWLDKAFVHVERAVDAASDQSTMRRALGLRLSKRELLQMQRRRDICEHHRILTREIGISANEAAKRVATERGMTAFNVKRIVSQWGGMVAHPDMRRRTKRHTTGAQASHLQSWLSTMPRI